MVVPWYFFAHTIVYHGIPWYTMVYHGIVGFTMVYHGSTMVFFEQGLHGCISYLSAGIKRTLLAAVHFSSNELWTFRIMGYSYSCRVLSEFSGSGQQLGGEDLSLVALAAP